MTDFTIHFCLVKDVSKMCDIPNKNSLGAVKMAQPSKVGSIEQVNGT